MLYALEGNTFANHSRNAPLIVNRSQEECVKKFLEIYRTLIVRAAGIVVLLAVICHSQQIRLERLSRLVVPFLHMRLSIVDRSTGSLIMSR